MGKRTPSPPPAPDPVATSQAQGAANRETAIAQAGLNAVNQRTPQGSLTYNQVGSWADGTPRFEAVQTLSPEGQQISDINNRASVMAGQTAVDQLGRVSGTLAQPFSLDGVNGQSRLHYLAGADRPVQYDIANAGGITRDIADAGGITRSIAGAGNITRNIADAGNITRDVDMTNQIADVGQARRSFDFTGLGDPNISRDRVEQALFNRLNPQLENDRQALEQRLVNQGVTPGSPAWTRAQAEFGQNVNDARNSAILNAGQEQSRLAGLGLSQAQLFNAGQGQDFGQAATRAGFFNDANLGRAGFQNAAQNQQFGQNAQQAAFQNAAQAQQYGQNAQDAAFQNAAQAQQFGQNFDRSQFANTAQNQQFGQNATAAQFGNAANQQNFNQSLTNANLNNATRQQAIQEALLTRQTPLNEFSALMSGAQVQQPNFVNTPTTQIQPTDVAGPIYQNYQGALNQYGQQVGSRNAAMGGLFGLAGAGLGGYLRRI
jgi:hypothetical protein